MRTIILVCLVAGCGQRAAETVQVTVPVPVTVPVTVRESPPTQPEEKKEWPECLVGRWQRERLGQLLSLSADKDKTAILTAGGDSAKLGKWHAVAVEPNRGILYLTWATYGYTVLDGGDSLYLKSGDDIVMWKKLKLPK